MAACRRGGFTLIELLVSLAIFSILLGLLLGAVQRVRARAAQAACADNLRQIGLALHDYHAATGTLPPGGRDGNDSFPYLAWSARLLPYLEQDAAWAATVRDFETQRYFAAPLPHSQLGRPLPVYLCPTAVRSTAYLEWEKIDVAFTYYLGVAGGSGLADGVLIFNRTIRLGEVTDGTSNTLLVGERPPSADDYFGWWYAGLGQREDSSADYILQTRQQNYTVRAPTCPAGPYHFRPGNSSDMCDTFHFWSHHPDGANFLFADGSVRFLRYSADSIMPALGTRAGGEAEGIPD